MPDSPQRVVWPPRLVGVFFDGPRPFRGPAYLAIDSLTVLLGANGAGKTTTLSVLKQQLPGLDRTERPPDDGSETDCTFFVEVTEEQLEALASDTVANQSSSAPVPVRWRWGRGPWLKEAIYRERGSGDTAAEQWLKAVAREVPSEDYVTLEALRELRESRILAVRWATSGVGCDVAWCSPSGTVEASASTQTHREEVGVLGMPPQPIAPLGSTERTMLPTAVSVPRSVDEIRAELREALLDILDHLRWGERDRWAATRGLPRPEAGTRRGTKAWLEHPESEAASIATDAKALCHLASQLSTVLAPMFISETDAVVISIEPIHEWAQGGPGLKLELSRRPGIVYPLERAADGHKVWLQLALLETVAILRRYLDVLEALLDRAVEGGETAGSSGESPDWQRYVAATGLLRAFTHSADADEPRLEQFQALRNVGHRLYLIDEPEQHLHPRLQRAATRWLAEAGTAGASQCVVVTHSPHYLRIPGRVAFAYLQALTDSDGSPRSVIRVLTPESVAASDAVALEMGFDRGELLSAVALIVFVEGEADKEFLEGLYARRLHHAGIALVPIHGAVAAQKKGVVDSEMVLVWTAVQVAVLLDNLIEEDWAALEADPEYCRTQARKSSSTELQAMAAVLTRARDVGREIVPVGIPVPDIFDLLDEDVLTQRFPKYPGHQAARDAWAEASGKQKINWKAYYRDQFDIVVEPSLFGEIARAMAANGTSPPAAENLVTRLEELSTDG